MLIRRQQPPLVRLQRGHELGHVTLVARAVVDGDLGDDVDSHGLTSPFSASSPQPSSRASAAAPPSPQPSEQAWTASVVAARPPPAGKPWRGPATPATA